MNVIMNFKLLFFLLFFCIQKIQIYSFSHLVQNLSIITGVTLLSLRFCRKAFYYQIYLFLWKFKRTIKVSDSIMRLFNI